MAELAASEVSDQACLDYLSRELQRLQCLARQNNAAQTRLDAVTSQHAAAEQALVIICPTPAAGSTAAWRR